MLQPLKVRNNREISPQSGSQEITPGADFSIVATGDNFTSSYRFIMMVDMKSITNSLHPEITYKRPQKDFTNMQLNCILCTSSSSDWLHCRFRFYSKNILKMLMHRYVFHYPALYFVSSTLNSHFVNLS